MEGARAADASLGCLQQTFNVLNSVFSFVFCVPGKGLGSCVSPISYSMPIGVHHFYFQRTSKKEELSNICEPMSVIL